MDENHDRSPDMKNKNFVSSIVAEMQEQNDHRKHLDNSNRPSTCVPLILAKSGPFQVQKSTIRACHTTKKK